MKITKSELKSIVKECLVELLNEGLAGSFGSEPKATQSIKPNIQTPFNESNHRPLNKPSSQLKEAIRREAGGNKVMESILADTAASTLPKFLHNEGKTTIPSVGGGLAENIVAATNPEELFGDDATSKWASLAFMDSPLKK
jgi:hypothetical protein